ncbi:MAG: nonstructural protein [Arizlama microvirus]|nr:MAG: nonstructural protein [Arizlama microvirus]
MSILRMYSLYDAGAQAYLRPFWSDFKVNAQRSFRQLVNQTDNSDNMVANHPDQFTLFELGEWDARTGVFSSHSLPLTLGNGLEYKDVAA